MDRATFAQEIQTHNFQPRDERTWWGLIRLGFPTRVFDGATFLTEAKAKRRLAQRDRGV